MLYLTQQDPPEHRLYSCHPSLVSAFLCQAWASACRIVYTFINMIHHENTSFCKNFAEFCGVIYISLKYCEKTLLVAPITHHLYKGCHYTLTVGESPPTMCYPHICPWQSGKICCMFTEQIVQAFNSATPIMTHIPTLAILCLYVAHAW